MSECSEIYSLRTVATLVSMWLAVSCPSTLAQSQPAITDKDIEAVQRQVRQPTESEIEAAQERHRMPRESELSRVPVPSTPRIDALKPAAQQELDLEEIANSFEQNRNKMERQHSAAPQPALLVFVTLGMPEATLERLIEQASRAGVLLVMRGLKNGSVRETASHVQKLIGNRQVAWQIDPEAFDRFQITTAPTFVLVKADAQTEECGAGICIASDGYVSISGDVTIDYALETIERRSPRFVNEARLYVRKIRG